MSYVLIWFMKSNNNSRSVLILQHFRDLPFEQFYSKTTTSNVCTHFSFCQSCEKYSAVTVYDYRYRGFRGNCTLCGGNWPES